MRLFADILIGLVAFIHLYILWLEMFAWNTRGRKAFKSLPDELFAKTKPMMANQGLYNGFLAAGLIWSLLITDHDLENVCRHFFLTCIIIAGIYGAVTVQKRIFYPQALPATVALAGVAHTLVCVYFFVLPKKYQKSVAENENSPFSAKEVGLSFCTTVVDDSRALPSASVLPDEAKR